METFSIFSPDFTYNFQNLLTVGLINLFCWLHTSTNLLLEKIFFKGKCSLRSEQSGYRRPLIFFVSNTQTQPTSHIHKFLYMYMFTQTCTHIHTHIYNIYVFLIWFFLNIPINKSFCWLILHRLLLKTATRQADIVTEKLIT